MTTFAEDETGIESSRPIELYDFDLSSGSHHVTSYHDDVVFGGNTYVAIPISRGNTTTLAIGQVRETTVTLPAEHPIALALLGAGIPPRAPLLTITQLQSRSGQTRRVWRGQIFGCSVDEQYARLRVPNATDEAFSIALPYAVASPSCNHALYDAGCKVPRAAPHKTDATVVAVDGVHVVVSTIFGALSQPARHGEIVRLADGERRTIVEQIDTLLTLDLPFSVLAAGDGVEVLAGCDLTIRTCRDKFNNVVNFGSAPELPAGNPMALTGLGAIVKE